MEVQTLTAKIFHKRKKKKALVNMDREKKKNNLEVRNTAKFGQLWLSQAK